MGHSRSRSHSRSPRRGEPRVREYASVPDHGSPKASDTDSTATNSSDEFDWDAEEDGATISRDKAKAKRMRRLWLLIMKLARPVRYVHSPSSLTSLLTLDT